MRSLTRTLVAVMLAALTLGGCATVPPRALAARPRTLSSPIVQVDASATFPLATLPTPEPPAEPTPTPEPTTEPTPPVEPTPEPTTPVDCKVQKCVALTLDDGPAPGTKKVLDLFAKEQVKATFFLLGENAKAHPGLVKRMIREGHELGNHSWSHPQFWHLSRKAIRRQVVRTSTLLAKLGQRPTLLRPPYGEWDHDVAKVSKSLGLPAIIWDVDPEDWKYRSAKKVAKKVLHQVKRGSIILTHDTIASTRKAYPAIIKGLKKKGYTLVTVSELIGDELAAGKRYYRA